MNFLSKLFKPKPFFDAIMSGKIKDVRKHLENGVDPNKKVDGGRAYPIHFAVHSGVEIVKILIDNKAKVNVKSDDEKTPLHIAAVSGYVDVVSLLIGAGSNVNAVDKYGHTPLFSALAEVTTYDSLITTFGFILSNGVTQEKLGRKTIVNFLRQSGAILSKDDKETIQSNGSIPEANRLNQHLTLAYHSADIDYKHAVQEISLEYPFLYDAFRLLKNKSNLLREEQTFVDNFKRYESMLH